MGVKAFLWGAVLCLMLAGCGAEVPEGCWLYEGSLPVRSCTEVWGYDYDWMNDRQKRAFDLLYGEYFSENVRADGEQRRYFTLPAPLSETELANVIKLYEMATDCYGYRAFRYAFADGKKGPGCELHVMAEALEYENEELNHAYDVQLALADEIISHMEPGLSPAEQYAYFFRYLQEHTEYYTDRDKGYTSVPEDFYGIVVSSYQEDYPYVTAYGALKDGLANCSGYALAFDLLAKRAGLPSLVVQGFLETDGDLREGHAWNMVQLEGKWYQIDVTRGDFLFGSGEEWHRQYSVRKYGHREVPLPECEPEPYAPVP